MPFATRYLKRTEENAKTARCQNHEFINVDIYSQEYLAESLNSVNPLPKQADDNYRPFSLHGSTLITHFPKVSHSEKTSQDKTVHFLHYLNLCGRFIVCGITGNRGKTWRWYLLWRVAVCLEAYARIPVIKFGTRLFAEPTKTIATSPMQATRGQANDNYQTIASTFEVGRRNPYSSATWTFSAHGPFCPRASLKVTRCPSRSSL